MLCKKVCRKNSYYSI